MAAGTVSTTLSEWLLVLLIVFTLIIEFILHRIEHWVKTRHHHLGPAVRVLYRELMILGLVSFLFIIYETVEKPKGDIILSFEFAHVFIFLLAIFYAIVVLSTMFTSLRLSHRWKKMEQIDLVNYLLLKDTYTSIKARHDQRPDAAWRIFLWWFPNFSALFEYIHLHEVMAFHDIRFQFIYYRNLPDQFRFSSFLRKVKASTFNELIESHWSLYVIFLVILGIDIIRRHATSETKSETDTVESAFIISGAVILAFFVQVLAVKIRRVFWQLTRHPRIYFESVEPAAVQAELLAAEQRMEEHRARRRSIDRPRPARQDTGEEADDEAVRASVDTAAETELLEPMRANPIKNKVLTREESDADAAPISHTSEVTTHGQSLNAAAFEARARNSMAKLHAMQAANEAGSSAAHGHTQDHGLGGHGHSHSHAHGLDELETSPDPAELRETAQRHSLDLSRHRAGAGAAPAPTSGAARRDASMAQTAIEAARKRAAEMEPLAPTPEDAARPPRRVGSAAMMTDMVRPMRRVGSNAIMSDMTRPPRRVDSAARLSALGGSQRDSIDDEAAATSSLDRIRASLDGRNSTERMRGSTDAPRGGRRRSVELSVAVPRDELAARLNAGERPAHTVVNMEPGESENEVSARVVHGPGKAVLHKPLEATGGAYFPRMFKDREQKYDLPVHSTGVNGTILSHLENQRNAENAEPLPWPRLLVKLIPRLGRVASPVEKLFWFGSHKFYLWCVEFVLFFSTVLMAAATATMSLRPLQKKDINTLNILSVTLATLNLLFVLFRIAGIIKKYIFILHNASLIPEIVAIEAIHTVAQKSAAQRKAIDRDNMSNMSGSETEMEEESALEKRRKLGRFFRSEVLSGNVPGIEGGERTSVDRPGVQKWRKRVALRRRRTGADGSQPDAMHADVPGGDIGDGQVSLGAEAPVVDEAGAAPRPAVAEQRPAATTVDG